MTPQLHFESRRCQGHHKQIPPQQRSGGCSPQPWQRSSSCSLLARGLLAVSTASPAAQTLQAQRSPARDTALPGLRLTFAVPDLRPRRTPGARRHLPGLEPAPQPQPHAGWHGAHRPGLPRRWSPSLHNPSTQCLTATGAGNEHLRCN